MKRGILLILFVGGMAFLGIRFVQAGAVGISPVTFELVGTAGEVIENYVKVYNPSSDASIKIRMEVEDIMPTGEEGQVLPVETLDIETYSIARWIKTDPEELALQPKEEKLVKFTITIPENAEPGGHYGVVLAGTRGIAGPGLTGAAITERVGTLVLLTVPGEMKEELIIKEFLRGKMYRGKEFKPRGYFEYGPVYFQVKLENKGTVHTRPVARIVITDLFGRRVANLELSEKNVLPGSTRRFELSLEKKWLWAGRYTASLVGTYGRGNTSLEPVVINFWAFPWKIGAGVFVVLIFFILTRRRWITAFKILFVGERALRK